MNILKPDLYYNSIFDIDLKKLFRLGIKGIILDVDNTLVPHNHPFPTKESIDFIKSAEEHGIKACVVSNNSKNRIDDFAKRLGVPYVCNARKPMGGGYKVAMEIMKTDCSDTATVGDQIFTDILGGKLLGILTILVKPISKNGETFFIRFKRLIEKHLVKEFY